MKAYMNTKEASAQIRGGQAWLDHKLDGWRLKDGRQIILDDWLPDTGVFDEGSPEAVAVEARAEDRRRRAADVGAFLAIVSMTPNPIPVEVERAPE